MQFGDARWSLGGPGWSPGTARGLPGGYRSQNECFRKFGKRCFWPPGTKRGGLGGILPPFEGARILAARGRQVRRADREGDQPRRL